MEHLGPFIVTFEKNNLPVSLLNQFHKLATVQPSSDELPEENDQILFCAYNFPAVLQTIGSERWSDIKDLYLLLIKEQQWKVRQTLSFSLNVVAEILGPHLTEQYLTQVFDLFLRDIDEVKVGVIKNFSKFISILSPHIRNNYLPLLEELNQPKVNWRFRRLIAKQLGDLSQQFPLSDVIQTILPITNKFLVDPAASVRKALDSQIGKIVNQLLLTDTNVKPQTMNEHREALLDYIKQLSKNPHYQIRISFCRLCRFSFGVIDINILQNVLLPALLELCTDKIANVRSAAAKTLSYFHKQDIFRENDVIKLSIHNLKLDSDFDVCISAGLPLPENTRLKNRLDNQ